MNERPKSNRRAAIGLVVVLLLWGSLGFLLLNRLGEMRQEISVLREQVVESAEKAQEAGATSRTALARAADAEENARQAALGRMQAEQARVEADQEAELAALEAQQSAREAREARQAADVANEQARLAREEAEQIRQRREAEIERLRQALGKIADTERTAVGLVMTLSSDSIHFDFDKAELRPDDRELLSRIAGVLLTAYGFRLGIHGHTDDVGSGEYNQGLSERRARSVRDYLVEAGIAADLITIKGFGKTSPRTRGATPEARARNRRVEIAIIDSVIDYQGEVSQATR
jgi:outer membrane protein OmpA-like peptidoglycan-associated protein